MNMKRPDHDILKHFSGKEEDEVRLIWEKARRKQQPGDDAIGVNPEEEWALLQKRIQPADRSGLRVRPRPLRTRSSAAKVSVAKTYAFITALAAVLLGGFIMWYLFMPVSMEAPRGEYAGFHWDDGIHVELNSGSRITWNRTFGNGHRNLRLHGEAYFEVQPSGKPFVVETQTARVEVLGTRFNVRSWSDDPDGRTTLTLVEGQVRLASLLEPESHILVQPGHTSQVDYHNTKPLDPQPVNTDQALAWRNHGFYFSGITMSEVAAELERRYDSEIIIQDEVLGDRPLTIYLPRPGELENIIETICFVTNCRYEEKQGTIYLY